MTIDVAKAPAFWATVAAHAECPPELHAALAAEDETARQKFEISSSKEMRAFLSTIDGWIPRQRKTERGSDHDDLDSDQTLAKFHDGRGGRVQYRIVGELPSELSAGGRVKVVERLLREFDRLGIPYVLAIHAPDHGNDEHQWHFHLDFYDRPARLLTEADLQDPRLKGLKPVGKVVGEWSFAAEFYQGARRDRTTRPFRQDKIQEVRESGRKKNRRQGWVEYLRRRFAFAVNQELRREGQMRRYDPRSYDAMGIKAEPGEHLGTRISAAESKGHVSDAGLPNEEKQWRAIGQEQRDRRATAFHGMHKAVADRRRRLNALGLEVAQAAAIEHGIAMMETAWRLAINADHQRAQAQQLTARACSRASGLERTNQRRLDAHDRGETVLTDRERSERTHVRDAAARHLARLEPFRQASVEAVMLCDTTYNDAVARRRAAETMVDTLLADAVSRERARTPDTPVERLAGRPAATPTKAQSPIPPAEAPIDALRLRLDRDRPLILRATDGYYLPSDEAGSRNADVQAELAQRHAVQNHEISEMIAKVERQRKFLRREADGWRLAVQDVELARRFEVLRAHPRLQKAIAQIIAVPGVVPSVRSVPAPVRPARVQAVDPVTQRKATEPEMVQRAVEPVQLPPVPPRTLAPPTVQAATAGPMATPVQRIIEMKARLKVGQDGLIDGDGLARQGIVIADADRSDRRLLGRAREQADHARRAVTGFIKKAPGFIVERDGHFSLSTKTKADIAMMAREHDSPAMQLVLRMAWEEHHASMAADTLRQPTADTPRLTVVERDDKMIAAANAYQEEQRRLVGEAAAKEAGATPAREAHATPLTAPNRSRRIVLREGPVMTVSGGEFVACPYARCV